MPPGQATTAAGQVSNRQSQSVELFEGLGNFARKVFSIKAMVITQTEIRGFQITRGRYGILTN